VRRPWTMNGIRWGEKEPVRSRYHRKNRNVLRSRRKRGKGENKAVVGEDAVGRELERSDRRKRTTLFRTGGGTSSLALQRKNVTQMFYGEEGRKIDVVGRNRGVARAKTVGAPPTPQERRNTEKKKVEEPGSERKEKEKTEATQNLIDTETNLSRRPRGKG